MVGNAPGIGSGFSLTELVTGLNTILLILTAVLSVQSYTAQVRAGIRESLEQLDDIELTHSYKIKGILHRFDYGILRPRTEIHVKFYNIGSHPSTANNVWFNPTLFRDGRGGKVCSYLKEQDPSIEDVEVVEDGLIIGIKSKNAVEIRRLTTRIMDEIKEMRDAVGNREFDSYIDE